MQCIYSTLYRVSLKKCPLLETFRIFATKRALKMSKFDKLTEKIVKLREREGQRVNSGRSLKGHL